MAFSKGLKQCGIEVIQAFSLHSVRLSQLFIISFSTNSNPFTIVAPQVYPIKKVNISGSLHCFYNGFVLSVWILQCIYYNLEFILQNLTKTFLNVLMMGSLALQRADSFGSAPKEQPVFSALKWFFIYYHHQPDMHYTCEKMVTSVDEK